MMYVYGENVICYRITQIYIIKALLLMHSYNYGPVCQLTLPFALFLLSSIYVYCFKLPL